MSYWNTGTGNLGSILIITSGESLAANEEGDRLNGCGAIGR